MPYKYDKLKGKIIEQFGSQNAFSKAIGLSRTSVSKKMNCQSGFSQKDMEEWARLLHIEIKDYGIYFFT